MRRAVLLMVFDPFEKSSVSGPGWRSSAAARLGEGLAQRGGQEGGVGSDRDETESALDVSAREIACRGENSGGLTVFLGGGEHPIHDGGERRAVHLQRNAQRERQIQRSDEQHIHAVLRGDLVDGVQRTE